MKFTDNEIREMRKLLSRNGVNALIRQMPLEEDKASEYIAVKLQIQPDTLSVMRQDGVPLKHARSLSEIAQKFEIKMYPYQFCPTTQICLNWLMHDYNCDLWKSREKQTFKFWDRDMSRHREVA